MKQGIVQDPNSEKLMNEKISLAIIPEKLKQMVKKFKGYRCTRTLTTTSASQYTRAHTHLLKVVIK
jgi:hypothetical protein